VTGEAGDGGKAEECSDDQRPAHGYRAWPRRLPASDLPVGDVCTGLDVIAGPGRGHECGTGLARTPGSDRHRSTRPGERHDLRGARGIEVIEPLRHLRCAGPFARVGGGHSGEQRAQLVTDGRRNGRRVVEASHSRLDPVAGVCGLAGQRLDQHDAE
jgi:hypothetical protein